MAVTNCKGEECFEEFVTKEYRLPTVEEGFEDVIELNIPVARRDCRVYQYDIPEVLCRVSKGPILF